MKNCEIVNYALEALKNKGAQKAQCIGTFSTTWEVNALAGQIELLRTINGETSIDMKGYFDDKMGGISISTAELNVIDEAAQSCLDNSKGAKVDATPAMNEEPVVKVFGTPAKEPDLEKMIFRTNEFLDKAREMYPNVLMRQMIVLYTLEESIYKNTFGVDITEYESVYSVSLMFSGFDGDLNSSFNIYGFTTKDLDTPFMDMALVSKNLAQAEKMVHTHKYPEKVVGTLLVTPHCLKDFLGQLMNAYASPNALVGGGSKWQNALDTKVACDNFSLYSKPLSENMAYNVHFTNDGFIAEDQPIIENGVLKGMFADHYTASKTGLPRRKSGGRFYTIPKGEKPLDEIIASIEDGIIINRFSGGYAGASGDLSGIAKNSFYIKNGKLCEAARETMISVNLSDLLMNIDAISAETVNDGSSELPYIAVKNVTIL
ncbi:MAG: hypothetical protein IKV63_05650 [Clostridia bacterium]|nr:hypothetical protein [Clostridia bacterium]